MSDVSITAASVKTSLTITGGSSQVLSSLFIAATFGEAVTGGQPVYFKAVDSKYYKANASDATKMPAVGVALGSFGVDQSGLICTGDAAFTPGFTVSAGAIYCVSKTSGAVCPSVDVDYSMSGAYVQTLYIGGSANTAQLITTAYKGVVHD